MDDLWPLVYSEKSKAVRALKSNELFIENVDYKPLAQNGERLKNGQFNGGNQITYMLSVPCLEFFIARKVRPVFEIYRQVFHNVASGELPMRMPNCIPGNTVGTLAPLATLHANIMERYDRVVRDSRENDSIVKLMQDCEEAYETYRIRVANLPYIEAVGILEGKEALQDRPIFP